jgi:putative ABC transport system permease protein
LGAILVVSAIGILAPFFVGPVGGAIGQIGQALTGESGRLARATIMRNPRRISSAASSLMISVCMCATTMLIVFGAVARYNESGQQTLLADSVVSSGREGLTSALPADVAKLTSGAPGVVAAEGATQSTVRLVEPLTTSMKSTDLVDPDSEDEMDDNGPIDIAVTGLDNPSTFLKLEGLTTAPALGEIALSSGRLQGTQLKVGDTIVVSAAAGKVRLRVIDDYRDISHLFADDALVSSATMQLLDPEAPTTAVFVRGGSPDTLRRHLGNIARVSDRSSYISIARQANVSGITLIYAFLGLTVIISLFGMATTISMNLFERTKEFGTLGAIGATQRTIRSIVYWETATVVALGVGTGLLEAFGIVHLIHLLTGSSFVRISSPVPVIAGMTLIGAALTFAMSVLPARRATQVSILEATRSA